jgi:hypothetical protein
VIKTLIIAVPLSIAAVAGAVYLVLAETAPPASDVKPVVAKTVEQGKRWFADRTEEIKRRVAEQTAAKAKELVKAEAHTKKKRVKNTPPAKPKAKKPAKLRLPPANSQAVLDSVSSRAGADRRQSGVSRAKGP